MRDLIHKIAEIWKDSGLDASDVVEDDDPIWAELKEYLLENKPKKQLKRAR